MPEEITIIDTRKVPSPHRERVGRMDAFITYQMPDMRTYMITLPAEDVTDAKLIELIRKDIQERASLTGKKLSV